MRMYFSWRGEGGKQSCRRRRRRLIRGLFSSSVKSLLWKQEKERKEGRRQIADMPARKCSFSDTFQKRVAELVGGGISPQGREKKGSTSTEI